MDPKDRKHMEQQSNIDQVLAEKHGASAFVTITKKGAGPSIAGKEYVNKGGVTTARPGQTVKKGSKRKNKGS